ncbi:hypothetical protein GYH30_042349 [Glycine max]|uniref:glucan endo-1,3-beta-D-glucosidase n=1 Tax=Glycine max TaxID=3847 RepID=K7MBB3_SOYBN|nr:hypothetical protein GYH30_042349 [Glycine max]
MASLFARTKWFSLPTLLLLLELFTINLSTADAQIGVCYGMIGDNLPPANEVVPALQALRNSGIELTLGVLQQDLQGLATNASIAQQWVQSNVLNFWPSVKIKYVVVGNEIDPVGSSSQFAQYVLPAIQNTYQAIRAQGLHDLIKVTTAISMDLLGNSYTPSQNYFKPDVRSYIDPIIGYLVYANAPLLANVLPYFSYANNSIDISVSYALFNKCCDGGFAATYDNTRVYLKNLILHAKRGNSRRPSKPTKIYIFVMFDENLKTPEIQKHFGLLFPNKTKKYPFGFN